MRFSKALPRFISAFFIGKQNSPSKPKLAKNRLGLTALLPILTTAIFLLPVGLGLVGTLLPAFGWLPVIGLDELSIAPWQKLFSYPGFSTALQHTLVTGIGSSLLSLCLTFLLLVGLYPSSVFTVVERWLSAFLSVPHAAFAIGLGFLIAPSGWLFRAIESIVGIFPTPPSWSTFQDPVGISLILTLALKETPFLVFMSLAVLPSLNPQKTLWLAKTMGHTSRFAWLWLIGPQLFKQLRLPFFAVVVYSLTVVDIAVVAGPTTPPTLAVMITQLFNDPNLEMRTLGAAGAILLLTIIIVLLAGLTALQRPFSRIRSHVIRQGVERKRHSSFEKQVARTIVGLFAFVYSATFLVTLLWSVTSRWRYPDVVPEAFSSRSWLRIIDRISEPLWCTFLLGFLSAVIAIVLVVVALENEVKQRYKNKPVNTQRIAWLIYTPLLVPQIAFLFGFQVSLIQLGIDGLFVSLLWSHLVFVLPYVFLTLSEPYRKFDDRYSWQALSLSRSRRATFWKVKIPILLRPILYSFAIGFSVSIVQYLPTLFIGAGKFSTVTTEAVAMAAGSDRRMMAVMAMWQQLLPLVMFGVATIVPAVYFRNRKLMRQSAS